MYALNNFSSLAYFIVKQQYRTESSEYFVYEMLCIRGWAKTSPLAYRYV